MIDTVKLIYHAAKVRLGFLIMSCALAGIAVSPGPDPAPWRILLLGIAVLVAASAAGAFNQLYERDTDRLMKRTQKRAFVTGELEANNYWVGGIGIMILLSFAVAAVATNFAAAFYVFLGAFTYGIVYTIWLKKKTWLNIVIGGLAGSFAVMAGSAAMGAVMAPAPLLLAVVLFLWTPPHFWALAYACKEDYRAAGVPMLPVVVDDRTSTLAILGHAIPLVILSVLPVMYGMGWIYLAGALSGGLYFIFTSIQLALKPGIGRAWRVFAASIVQLGLLLTAAILDNVLLG